MARPGLGQAARSGGLVSRGEGSLPKQPSVPPGHKSAHRGLDIVCSQDLGPILCRDTQHSRLGGQPAGPSPGESKHLPPSWGLVCSSPPPPAVLGEAQYEGTPATHSPLPWRPTVPVLSSPQARLAVRTACTTTQHGAGGGQQGDAAADRADAEGAWRARPSQQAPVFSLLPPPAWDMSVGRLDPGLHTCLCLSLITPNQMSPLKARLLL
ncbi:uncharacterized protein LOC113251685 [Ursus arctos]|uniref:uncharacterized protein LOC113251685 n=1 Tax=Ursus arctos TaxID=9644 RepID=UPI000E6DE57C|nr:uncharacterized protein LOC113251685 [Ursus arctos]